MGIWRNAYVNKAELEQIQLQKKQTKMAKNQMGISKNGRKMLEKGKNPKFILIRTEIETKLTSKLSKNPENLNCIESFS